MGPGSNEKRGARIITFQPFGATGRAHIVQLNKHNTSRETERFFRPELDVLRLFAFCLVFAVHTVPEDPSQFRLVSILARGAGFGVQVFFVLSAYLITELLSREKRTVHSVDLRSFYIRRILRIWPLYFAVLFLCAIVWGVIEGPGALRLNPFLAYIFLAGNWYAALYGGFQWGFGVIWSVNVEEQFYLILPLVLRAATRKGLLILCIVMWSISQVAVAVMVHNRVWAWTVGVVTVTHLQYFGIGAAISLLLNGRIPQLNVFTRTGLVAIGLTLFALLPAANPAQYLPFLSAGIASALIFMGFLGAKIPKYLSGFQYLGKISYGLYMLHNIFLVQISYWAPRILHVEHNVYILKFVLGLPLTIGLAHLSYRYFEKPFLRLKERFELIHSRPA